VSARIAFIGDTLLGGEAQAVLDARGYDYALRALRPLLRDADLVVVNHEGPLTTRDQPDTKLETGRRRYWYRADPSSAVALAAAGVRVVSLANNHVLDFGVDGLEETLSSLDAAGIAHCGAGPDDASARRPVIIDAGGLRIGFLSTMQRYHLYVRENLYASTTRAGPARLRLHHIRQDIAALRRDADVCVVLVHWGRNYRGVSPRQERLARALREAGADLIVGHHPHIPQRVEVIGSTPVLYSLGNGALGTPGRFHSGRPPYGLVAIADVARHSVTRLRLCLLHVNNDEVLFQPRPVDPSAQSLLASLVQPAVDASSEDGWLTIDLERLAHEPERGSARG
jgi:poly-gamma-glutamate capsule biosynthesis protein CapA/YwtB (metallophosphatase superfamily)